MKRQQRSYRICSDYHKRRAVIACFSLKMMASRITVQSKTFTLAERKRIQLVRSGKMGTNFYWKEVPRELEKYKAKVEKYIGAVDDNPDNVLLHIGKRSAAGRYCHYCGTTLNKHGTDHVHDCEYDDWYEVCPICGRKVTPICSFRWTFMKHKWIVERLYNENCKEKLIVDEYGNEYTPIEFRDKVRTPIEYQLCNEFC